MSEHALFSPSAVARWTACPGSLAASRGKSDAAGEYAAQGTVAHDLARVCLTSGGDPLDFVGTTVLCEGFEIEVDDEMGRCIEAYCAYARALPGTHYIETRVHTGLDKDCWGTLDFAAVDGPHAVFVDLKYGRGVGVDARENAQMSLYALGLLAKHPSIKTVDLVIFQPRKNGAPDVWSTTTQALLAFGTGVVGPAITRAKVQWLRTDGVVEDLHAGEHCRFCPARSTCTALAQHATAAAQRVFAAPHEATTDMLAQILIEADLIDAWVGAVRKEALTRAERGEPIPGHKLVPKRAVRSWIDSDRVVQVFRERGLDPLGEPPVLSPAQMEKKYKKQLVAEVAGSLIQSISSGVTLVADSDPRPAVMSDAARVDEARAIFAVK
jgi:hypothetical protein